MLDKYWIRTAVLTKLDNLFILIKLYNTLTVHDYNTTPSYIDSELL